jgi:soluble lytic murein transglycosylase-like protein
VVFLKFFLERRSMVFLRAMVFGLTLIASLQPFTPAQAMTRAELDALIAAHAAANGVPVALVHRVIIRESRYNPRTIGTGGAMGLMQIKTATARGVGYAGSAAGLLDPQTNLTYAVRYLAGAYRLAGGNHDRAVSYYAGGYYYAAKGQGRTVAALAGPGPILRSFPSGRGARGGKAPGFVCADGGFEARSRAVALLRIS